MKKSGLTPIQGNYLYAVLEIENEKKAARVKDLTAFLSLGAAAVSESVKNLAEKGYLNYEPYGLITLTDAGRSIAEEKARRRKIVADFFVKVLDTTEEDAIEASIAISAVLSENIISKIVSFLSFMNQCICKEPCWLVNFKSDSIEINNCNRCDNCTNKE